MDDDEMDSEAGVPRLRSPLVTIELQLVPPVPKEAEPYWWGYHTLTFRVDGVVAWEADVLEAESSSWSARTEHRDGYGWVVILTLLHDKARKALAGLALPDRIEGKPG